MAISRQKSFHLLNQIPRTHFLHAVLQFLLQGQAPNQHRPSVCFLTYLHEKKAGKYFPCILPEFHSLYLQIEANIPRWTAYLHAQDPDMGWLMSRLEGIDWEQLLHKVTSGLDTVLVNAAGAVSATVNLVVTASFALIIRPAPWCAPTSSPATPPGC